MGQKYEFLTNRTGNAGFSLVEILVSIVILSVGLLGVVGLQAAALKANREAANQSSASRYGRDLAEMMKGNRAVASQITAGANPYVVSFSEASNALTTVVPEPADSMGSAVGTATGQVVAQWEVREWLYRLNHELPGARVVVCFDASPYDADGLPQWACSVTGTVAVIKIGWSRSSLNSQATADNAFDRATTPAVMVPVSF